MDIKKTGECINHINFGEFETVDDLYKSLQDKLLEIIDKNFSSLLIVPAYFCLLRTVKPFNINKVTKNQQINIQLNKEKLEEKEFAVFRNIN